MLKRLLGHVEQSETSHAARDPSAYVRLRRTESLALRMTPFCHGSFATPKMTVFIASLLLPTFTYAAGGIQSSAPVNITSDTLSVDQNNLTATFSGSVEALQRDVTLRAEKMVVHYSGESEDGKNISSIEVVNNVIISRPGETAKGDAGVYDVKKNTLTLTGNVILNKDNNMVRGTNLVYNLDTGQSQITGGKAAGNTSGGRVSGTFIPSKKDK